jgi:hypothetical protein
MICLLSEVGMFPFEGEIALNVSHILRVYLFAQLSKDPPFCSRKIFGHLQNSPRHLFSFSKDEDIFVDHVQILALLQDHFHLPLSVESLSEFHQLQGILELLPVTSDLGLSLAVN